MVSNGLLRETDKRIGSDSVSVRLSVFSPSEMRPDEHHSLTLTLTSPVSERLEQAYSAPSDESICLICSSSVGT